MSRPLRINVKDGCYHVTSRGNERKNIVRDDRDRNRWASLLDQTVRRRRWRVFAYALLDNHFHIYLQVPDADLSEGMAEMLTAYSVWFNKRHRRTGHLFQGRFKSILVESAGHDWELTRYVHLNPVRAGLAIAPEKFQWGSCRFYFNQKGAPEWLDWQRVLQMHGKTLGEARKEYAAYLLQGMQASHERPTDEAYASTVLGSSEFLSRIRELLLDRGSLREVPASRAISMSFRSESIEAAVSAVYDVERTAFMAKRSTEQEARGAALFLMRQMTALALADIGKRFGGVSAQSVAVAVSRFAKKYECDAHVKRKTEKCRALVMAACKAES